MEYLGGGEVKWVDSLHQPIQTVDQTWRIIQDVVLGLEYRKVFFYAVLDNNLFDNFFLSALPGYYPP